MHATPSLNLPVAMPPWPAGKTPLATAEDAGLPTFTYYLPSDEYRTGQSVLILPGGGYGSVSSPKEGHRPAQLLAAHGMAAAVLEYRHAPSRHPVPLIDAQRGMRLLRRLAADNSLRTDAVGVMGFSAGGHLAGTVATQPPHEEGLIGDALDGISPAADFAVLIYAVVSLTAPHAHVGSAHNLLGNPPDPALAARLSIDQSVTNQTPPMFIAHMQGDKGVPSMNALALHAELTRHNVPSVLHIYEGDVHGIGLAANHPWGRDLLEWLAARK